MNRAGTPGSTREPGIQALGEGEGVPRHEQTVQEASHETGARARIAARIRERAGKRAVDRGEGGFAHGRGQQGDAVRRSARIGRAPEDEEDQGNWARRGKSRGQRDAGLKSTTRHDAAVLVFAGRLEGCKRLGSADMQRVRMG